jgi:hypothetical protein
MRWQFEDIAKVENEKPFMLCFDEFQFARSVDQLGNSLDKTASRIVWEILDDGEVNLNTSRNHTVQQVADLSQILKRILKEDVQVQEGRVVSGMDLYRHYMKRAQFELGEENNAHHFFVPKRCYSTVLEIGRDYFSTNLDVGQKFNQLNGGETIELLEKIIEKGTLSSRIKKALPAEPEKNEIKKVYEQLGECLAEGKLFIA